MPFKWGFIILQCKKYKIFSKKKKIIYLKKYDKGRKIWF
jgi:hypothetical protein